MKQHTQSISELNSLLVERGVEDVVAELVGSGNYRKESNRLSMASYQGGKDGGSFSVVTHGQNAGLWREHNPNDYPNALGQGDLIELWSLVRGINKGEACKEVRSFLGLMPGDTVKPKRHNFRVIDGDKGKPAERRQRLSQHLGEAKPASAAALNKYVARLLGNEEALKYLYERGLTDETIRYFQLGLSTPYKNKAGNIQKNALVLPIVRQDGQYATPMAYYNIPGVTENPLDDNGWCKSTPRLTYNTERRDSHDFLLYAEGMKDLWALHQLIVETDLFHRILICSSTHGSRIPLEVANDPMFFSKFKRVLFAHDADEAGDKMADQLAVMAGTKAFRLRPPYEPLTKGEDKDWGDFVRNGGTALMLSGLIEKAKPIRQYFGGGSVTNINDLVPGGAYDLPPLDINNAYVGGYLYYPTRSFHVVDEGERKGSHIVQVVRSDRVLLDYKKFSKFHRDNSLDENTYILSDGTMLTEEPKVSGFNTWRYGDIRRWLEGNEPVRPLREIINDLVNLIREQIWLPNNDDYLLMALVVVMTYVQDVFEAVPLVLATGAAGSGKSQLGDLVVKVGCNGISVGETSAATLTRTLEQHRGFLFLDDVEKIRQKVTNAGATDDFLQILKVSYKKSTATRAVTDPKSMEVRMLNFFGIKFMTNTMGIEDILQTRAYVIHTRRAPKGLFSPKLLDIERTDNLQRELHAWAMDNIQDVDRCYREYPQPDRPSEITAPARALIDVAGVPEWHEVIDRLIARMALEQQGEITPEEITKEAVLNIASRGFTSVSIEQVIMEIRTMVPENFGKEHTTQVADWERIDWVKRQVLNQGYIPSHTDVRRRPYAGMPARRLYQFNLAAMRNDMTDEQLQLLGQAEPISGQDFCKRQACQDCPYNTLDCDIRNKSNKNRANRFS